ncbi:hypothetical protein C4K39_5338 [Pseudomonas sessilinigenes]|nr:hypothetical protein C4K39_5338 [Pseudomonas sessilinigenes]
MLFSARGPGPSWVIRRLPARVRHNRQDSCLTIVNILNITLTH